ncbi:MAG: hypothetical protein CMO80_07085 [Verrucomicrobiales bacterium]|nr:hypothetical protein [Verrucomicrobiales bacterium]|tara:strand:- start:6560 stop:7921 length:1362 start_codon:yes stop_codon:yes gene_type:complete
MRLSTQRLLTSVFLFVASFSLHAELRIAVFDADVTPPIGAPLCNGSITPVKKIEAPLSARGIVILGSGKPIVLCAFDWVGIGNAAHDEYCTALAKAAGTTADRVTVHTLHQHDAPAADYSTEELLKTIGLGGSMFDPAFAQKAIINVAHAVKESLKHTKPVTHVGLGQGKVEKVASNRRILGDNGRVKIVRYSSSRNPAAIAAPEGVIDPMVKLIAFWNGDKPVAGLTHYATHPQSYYGRGGVNPDFPGMARSIMGEEIPEAMHVHFAGAGGNVGAGKYNNGSPELRPILAKRLAAGMRTAWKNQEKFKVSSKDIGWEYEPVSLPVRKTISEESRLPLYNNPKERATTRRFAARDLVFLRRTKAGHKINLNCLRVAKARILYMPGELFVEYQLGAQKMAPNLFVAMAAYGQYSPGYIGDRISYTQGGYETGRVSRVDPSVEDILNSAMKNLLD